MERLVEARCGRVGGPVSLEARRSQTKLSEISYPLVGGDTALISHTTTLCTPQQQLPHAIVCSLPSHNRPRPAAEGQRESNRSSSRVGTSDKPEIGEMLGTFSQESSVFPLTLALVPTLPRAHSDAHDTMNSRHK